MKLKLWQKRTIKVVLSAIVAASILANIVFFVLFVITECLTPRGHWEENAYMQTGWLTVYVPFPQEAVIDKNRSAVGSIIDQNACAASTVFFDFPGSFDSVREAFVKRTGSESGLNGTIVREAEGVFEMKCRYIDTGISITVVRVSESQDRCQALAHYFQVY